MHTGAGEALWIVKNHVLLPHSFLHIALFLFGEGICGCRSCYAMYTLLATSTLGSTPRRSHTRFSYEAQRGAGEVLLILKEHVLFPHRSLHCCFRLVMECGCRSYHGMYTLLTLSTSDSSPRRSAVGIVYIAHEQQPHIPSPNDSHGVEKNEERGHVSLVPSVPRQHLCTPYLNVLRTQHRSNDDDLPCQTTTTTATRKHIQSIQANVNCYGRGGDPNEVS
jgi:hypothetical protein